MVPPENLGFTIILSVMSWGVGSLFGILTNLRLISIFRVYSEAVKWCAIVVPGIANFLWISLYIISVVWGKQQGEVNQTSIAFLQATCALLPLCWAIGWAAMAGLLSDPQVEKKA